MGKNNGHGRVPPKSTPFPVQVRLLSEQNDALKASLNKLRRMIWIAIHQSNGRINITESDYMMAMQMPDEDCIVSLKHFPQEPEHKLALVFTDEKGNILPESEKSPIIITDGQ